MCISVPIMAWTTFPSAQRCWNLFLAMDCRHTTSKGRVNVARSSFISRLMNQFSFFSQRSMMIATFNLDTKRAFSDALEGVVLKTFSGGKPPDPHISSLFFHNSPLVLQK